MSNIKLVFYDFVGTFGGAQQSTVAMLNALNYELPSPPLAILPQDSNKQFVAALKCEVKLLSSNDRNFNIFRVGRSKIRGIMYLLRSAIQLHELLKDKSFRDKRIVFLCNSSKALVVLSLIRLTHFRNVRLAYYARGWGKFSQYSTLTRMLLRHCTDVIFCVSQQTKQNLMRVTKHRQRLLVTYTSVDHSILPIKPLSRKSSLDRINLLFAGAILPTKGIHLIIEALSKLDKETRSRFHLYIAGNFNLKETRNYYDCCSRLAADSSVNITWMGWRDDVPDLIFNSDIVCLPSYSEGMPRIVQEAMYVGTLAIATPVGGIPEIIIPQETGFLMEIDNSTSLFTILEHVAKAGIDVRMIQQARSLISSKFSLSRQAHQIKTILDKLWT